MGKYKVEDKAYIVESNHTVKEVTILKYSAGLYTVRIGNGAIRVKEHRLFESEEAAKASLPNITDKKQVKKYKSHYDYGL